jgi:hypothetical protein
MNDYYETFKKELLTLLKSYNGQIHNPPAAAPPSEITMMTTQLKLTNDQNQTRTQMRIGVENSYHTLYLVVSNNTPPESTSTLYITFHFLHCLLFILSSGISDHLMAIFL